MNTAAQKTDNIVYIIIKEMDVDAIAGTQKCDPKELNQGINNPMLLYRPTTIYYISDH